MIAAGIVRGQRQIRVNLAEKEPGTGLPIEQIRVLADPAQTRGARQRLFQHRGAVGEHPVAEVADGLLDFVRELLQPLAHELVIIPPEGVARHVGQRGLLEHIHGRGRAPGQVIQAYRDDPQGARVQ